MSKNLLIFLILLDIHQYKVFDHNEYISGLQYAFNAFLCCFSEHFCHTIRRQNQRKCIEVVIPEFLRKLGSQNFQVSPKLLVPFQSKDHVCVIFSHHISNRKAAYLNMLNQEEMIKIRNPTSGDRISEERATVTTCLMSFVWPPPTDYLFLCIGTRSQNLKGYILVSE